MNVEMNFGMLGPLYIRGTLLGVGGGGGGRMKDPADKSE